MVARLDEAGDFKLLAAHKADDGGLFAEPVHIFAVAANGAADVWELGADNVVPIRR